ncbi:MAG: ADP-forming succinate--CoA ligase subunit beta [Candidatus Hydrogenedentota bacterium]
MNLHEYQAKALLRMYGVPAPDGIVARTAEEAARALNVFSFPVVLKAQVHAGGRGKAGGVRIVNDASELRPAAQAILELTIQDRPVQAVFITPAAHIAQEVYLSLLIDRGERAVSFVGCAEGGVDIEATAKEAPEKVFKRKIPVSQLARLNPDSLMDFAGQLFEVPSQVKQTAGIMARMGRLFAEKDVSLIEINPLIADTEGTILALDAKMTVDNKALFRHEDLQEMRKASGEDPSEAKARAQGLAFIRFDGDIGCMVNGAGLAMATMDIIQHHGGQPANFLDVGGSSNPKKVVAAFELILQHPGVKVIFVNIFGGITRYDDIAEGILTSLETFDVSVPIVVRLVGTNEAEGRAMLEQTGIVTAATLEEGAREAVKIAGAA